MPTSVERPKLTSRHPEVAKWIGKDSRIVKEKFSQTNQCLVVLTKNKADKYSVIRAFYGMDSDQLLKTGYWSRNDPPHVHISIDASEVDLKTAVLHIFEHL